ncbi:YcaO-like family protein [Pyxidicoccus fallax]|uniref:YcaO-like family protein n=1 Tax=Pyxidicoccus fallax TaxID=394095 RepID=A0A848L9P9_9BACT|nr:YcaO-like family protein [Pyxidicoccus fallax]NMO15760.1 YcaO-like family protein [Pyxidicoccus fallax]NPC77298.1 YcaO-like family protein [Pyxidicoccus fallax]
MSLSTAREAYARAMPPGELLLFRDDAIDRVGIPIVASSLRMKDGPWMTSHGYGATEDEAMVSAIGGLAEEVFAETNLRTLPRVHGSYRALVRGRGPSGVVDPLTLCLPAGSPYHPDLPLTWVEVERLSTGERVLMPEEYVAIHPGQLQGRSPLILPITNGQGAGLSRPQALAHALLELLQRDGNSVRFRAMDQGVVLDLEGAELSLTLKTLLAQYRRLGIDIIPKLASTEFGLVNLYVVANDPDVGRQSLMVTACGEAADPDRDRALRKALLEYAGSRARKAFMHGPLDEVARVAPPGYLERFLPHVHPEREEERALRGMAEWASMSAEALRALTAVTVQCRRKVRLSELPRAQVAEEPATRCQQVVAWLHAAGFDVLVADLSPADHSIHVVKAIVPGLEVETMTHDRIGERNVARLMSMGEPLAGLGTPPAGALPVRLTQEAKARLGGPAWFDAPLAARRVGRLYPLYREPGRHSVQQVLHGRRFGGGLS